MVRCVMYALCDDRNGFWQMSLKIEKSAWSEPFALDAVGTNGIVKCAYKGAMVSDIAEEDVVTVCFINM